MTAIMRESYVVGGRTIMRTYRVLSVALSLTVQPLIWLVLFSQLFSRSARAVTGSGEVSYLTFVLPGILAMAVLITGLNAGIGMMADVFTGILEKLLVSPIRRISILIGRLLADGARMAQQVIMLNVVAFVLGARFEGGVLAVVASSVLVILLGLVVASASTCLALRSQRLEGVGMAANFLLMPLVFFSPAIIDADLMPEWMRVVSRANPLSHVVEASRGVMLGTGSWASMAWAAAIVLGVGAVVVAFTVRTFRRTLT